MKKMNHIDPSNHKTIKKLGDRYNIKRLTPGDEKILDHLGLEEPDFDLKGRGSPLKPLNPEDSRLYLENPNLIHWVAVEDNLVIGHLLCFILPLRNNDRKELILYEIGVRSSYRRKGVGSALINHMYGWMDKHKVGFVWVLADNSDAAEFYKTQGFECDKPQPLYMFHKV